MTGRRRIVDARDNILSPTDEMAIKIVRRLIRNTDFFHTPKEHGPKYTRPDYTRPELKIATVENRLMLPSDRRPGPFHFERFKFAKHLQPVLDAGGPKAKMFEGLTDSMFTHVKLVVLATDFDFKGYRIEFLKHVDQAIKDGAQAICFGELAYPDPGHHADEYYNHKVFEDALQRRADDHDLVIIAGSYHRLTSQTNECRIFLKRDVDTKDDIILDDSPRRYTKRVPAQKIGEVTRRPVGINFPRYKTSLGEFAVMICLDSFDPTLFLRFLSWHTPGSDRHEGKAAPLDVIFVPSYSSNDKGWPMARYLSYVSQTIVVYVDAAICDPYSEVFLCGKPAAGSRSHKVSGNGNYYKLTSINFVEYEKTERRKHIETLGQSMIFQKLVRNLDNDDDGTVSRANIG